MKRQLGASGRGEEDERDGPVPGLGAGDAQKGAEERTTPVGSTKATTQTEQNGIESLTGVSGEQSEPVEKITSVDDLTLLLSPGVLLRCEEKTMVYDGDKSKVERFLGLNHATNCTLAVKVKEITFDVTVTHHESERDETFLSLCKSVARSIKHDVRFQSAAICALREASEAFAEDFVNDLFEEAAVCASIENSEEVQAKHIKLAMRIRKW